MQIFTSARQVELTPNLQSHIQEALDRAVGRFESRLRSVDVRLEDQNGPKGGVDIRCRILARLEPRGTLVVDDVQPTPGQAVEVAADLLARNLQDDLERRRDLRRQGFEPDAIVQ